MDTTLILPTLNEEKNIKELLDIVFSLYPDINAIVADDGSTDNTQDIVFDYKGGNVTLLDRSKENEKGITASVLDAARLVTTKNMLVMDADLQHPPEKVKEIIDDLRFNDLVVGMRGRVDNEWPVYRKVMSWGGDAVSRVRLALKPYVCLDTMSGFFGIKANLFRQILSKHEGKFEKKGYKILFDTLKDAPNDMRLGHVTYSFGTRQGGESKIGLKHVYYHIKSLLK